MRGPVATVGGRVIDSQAKRVISTTFANVKSKLSPATVAQPT
jgi:carbon monoxide dehydrogenase subunit G